jgi:hypothetical protein
MLQLAAESKEKEDHWKRKYSELQQEFLNVRTELKAARYDMRKESKLRETESKEWQREKHALQAEISKLQLSLPPFSVDDETRVAMNVAMHKARAAEKRWFEMYKAVEKKWIELSINSSGKVEESEKQKWEKKKGALQDEATVLKARLLEMEGLVGKKEEQGKKIAALQQKWEKEKVALQDEATVLKARLLEVEGRGENKGEQEKKKIAALQEEVALLQKKAAEEANDSEEQFSRLALEHYEQKRQLNACMATLVKATVEGVFEGVLETETVGAIFDTEVWEAVMPDRKRVSWPQALTIFNALGSLLTDPRLQIFHREGGEIKAADREAARTAMEKKECVAKLRRAGKLGSESMGNLVDLFVMKRRALEERCPSGLYASDLLWHPEKDQEMTLEEAVREVVRAYKEQRNALVEEEDGGEGKRQRKKRRE